MKISRQTAMKQTVEDRLRSRFGGA